MSDRSAFVALNKVAKWRNFFASWQLGTRPDTDGEYKALADQRELLILMRVELNALTELFLKKGLLTQQEVTAAFEREARALDKDYEDRFRGFSTSGDGLHMKLPEAAETMRKLGFPP
jgi:hypothetical protein